MILLVCIDDNGGMMFNLRRLSRDSAVIKDIVQNVSKEIWMNEYSKPLFDGSGAECRVSEDFLGKAAAGECCFVENLGVAEVLNKAERLIVYKWNRRYPSDFSLDIKLFDDRLFIRDRSEFAGSSHEKITKEVYDIKRGK